MFFLLGSLLFLISSVTQAKQVPFDLCGSENHLGVEQISISPYPARAGSPLEITVTGKSDLDIEDGTKVHMDVKVGKLQAAPKEYLLCDVLSGTTCPIKAHTFSTLVLAYNVTRLAPTGTATSTVTATDKDGKVLGCLILEIDVVKASLSSAADGRAPGLKGFGKQGHRHN